MRPGAVGLTFSKLLYLGSMISADSSASIDVSLAARPLAYSRNLFGHFIEHFHRQIYGGIFCPGSPLSDKRGLRTDVIEAMRELKPSVVRWPGGCFVSSYHWLDGVGPDRRPHYDMAWRVTDPNTFGTAEFVEWCAEIGAEPYICTNAGTGGAEEMASWVEYCNLPEAEGRWSGMRGGNGDSEPYNVRYWSIGNENYGDWEIGAKEADEWSRLVTESAKMMRHVDEDLVLLTAARADLDWMLPLLQRAGSKLDALSIHGYWDTLNQVNKPADYLTALSHALEPQDDIQRTREIIGATGLTGKVGIAFDEWNLRGWHHPVGNKPEAIAARDKNDENSTYTMADALFTAGFLNICLRNADAVTMANIAPSVNARGPLFVHDGGVVRRTTFHALAMYANLLGDTVLSTSATSANLAGAEVPVLDHIVTHDSSDDSLVLALINRDPVNPLPCTVSVSGRTLSATLDATVLEGPDADAFNDVDAPDRVAPSTTQVTFDAGVTTLPPHSLTICRLPLSQATGERYIETVGGPAGEWYQDGNAWRRA